MRDREDEACFQLAGVRVDLVLLYDFVNNKVGSWDWKSRSRSHKCTCKVQLVLLALHKIPKQLKL